MTLRGLVHAFPLETVLQLLAETGKTGELGVRGEDGRAGALGMSEGKLVSARYDGEHGEAALGALFTIQRGAFDLSPLERVEAGGTGSEQALAGELDDLLDRAVTQRDRLIAIRELIPHDRVRFRLSERAAELPEIRLSADQWRALLTVDSQRDVRAIAEKLGIRRFAALEVLAGLMRAGMIDAAGETAASDERSGGPEAAGIAPTASGEPVDLRGDVPDFPLDAIVQLLAATKKTGRLEVRSGTERYELGLGDGRLVSASYEEEKGELALGAAFTVERGEFEYVPTASAPEANLDGDLEALLYRAELTRDRIAADRALVPSERARFRLSERAAEHPEITLNPDQWRALLAVNGERDVAAIAQQLRMRRLPAMVLMAGLVREGLVDVVEAPAREAAVVSPPPEAPAAPEPMPAALPAAPEREAPPPAAWEPPPAEAAPAEAAAGPAVTEAPPAWEPSPPAWEAPPAPAWEPAAPAWEAPAVEPPPAEPQPAELDPRLAVFGAPAAPGVMAEPMAVAPAIAVPEKKKGLRGLFARPAPAAVAPAAPPGVRPAQLAAFANELLAGYNSGRYGKGRVEDRMPSRLMRVDEQADPIDRPLPTVNDGIDVSSLEHEGLPDRQTLPYLATLVRLIYEDAERALGRDKAKRGFRDARDKLFGKDLSLFNAPEVAGRIPKV